ncbi:MAG: HlyC/CorC family transporter [Planctomycetaceae bacterium]|nr:HlyC/CorC family transporter [Planctomycetaceae bacterium]MCB9954016.1 HlyC/CorC family transporter [Planctomycetaceae bacterium]
MIPIILSSLGFGMSLFLALSAYSLRNFFRAQLAIVCRKRSNEERFGEILRDDESALESCEMLGHLAFAGGLVSFMFWQLSSSPSPYQLTSNLLLLALGIWLLLFVFPWGVSHVASELFLFYFWPVIRLLIPLTTPLRFVAGGIDTMVHRIAGRTDPEQDDIDTLADEIQSVVDEGEREGLLESRAGKMIYRLMEFQQEDVRAIMTPRTEIISIDVEATLEEARTELLEAGHSRIPVIGETPDDVIGILYARDLLEHIVQTPHKSLSDIVREPFYVPETTTIENLLETMKRERLHLAIILDEYGGVAGLVTLEDILEEIVGDIADEFDEEENDQVLRIDDYTLSIDARIHLDEMNDHYDVDFPEDDDFDTMGGFVFSELGRIPRIGESFHWGSILITVTEATSRQVLRLELKSDVVWPHTNSSQRLATSSASSTDNSQRLVPRETESTPPESP